jgi:hypothetical protein
MYAALKTILVGAIERLESYAGAFLPPLLAAMVLLCLTYLAARSAHWVLSRAFKGEAVDRFLRLSGIAFLLDRSGRLRATRIVAEFTFWSIIIAGLMLSVSVFDTNLSARVVNAIAFLLPKLVTAGLILLSGTWLSLYCSRSVLVWAVNEDLPSPRHVALGVRVFVFFVAVVVAADQLDFARGVFLAAFIIILGGAVLTAGLAIGIAAGRSMAHFIERKRQEGAEAGERSLWTHL